VALLLVLNCRHAAGRDGAPEFHEFHEMVAAVHQMVDPQEASRPRTLRTATPPSSLPWLGRGAGLGLLVSTGLWMRRRLQQRVRSNRS
jgi:hypothetical protein